MYVLVQKYKSTVFCYLFLLILKGMLKGMLYNLRYKRNLIVFIK